MKGKSDVTTISRTIDYSPEAWKYYEDVGEIFEWDEKIDGETQLGIRIHQTQRTGFITPIKQYGLRQENEGIGKGSAEMLDDGDMPEYTSLYT